ICIVNNSFVPAKNIPSTLTLIKVEDAYSCFARLLEIYDQMKRKQPKVEASANISESASIGKDPYIGAGACISEGAKLGDNVVIYPNVYIGENVVIGDHTIVHPNA